MHSLLRWRGPDQTKGSEFLTGFLFWVAFLLVLEPDNASRAAHAGHSLSWDHELGRILGAAAIGAAAMPLVLYMTRNHPLEGARRWRNAIRHLLSIGGMAVGLIVSSCFAAAWAFDHRPLPSLDEVWQELISNFTLLLFALACLTAITHAMGHRRISSTSPASPPEATPLRRLLVVSRGNREWLAIADVDWVESQGNYVSMHVGTRTHWVRQTLSAFEAQLDPARFARIHRRTIVALDRISQIKAEGNGNLSIRLMDGKTLRASRKYRKELQDRWLGFDNKARKSHSSAVSEMQ
jgi:hypothetical protein